MNPTGGLARRKTVLDSLEGPKLVLDSGNALFRNAGVATEEDKARAAFIDDVMGRLGTRAAAVGQRDLSAGVAWLEALAKRSKLTWLSANLVRSGKPVFPSSASFEVNGVKVAVVGLTAPGPVAPDQDVQGLPTVAAAKAAVAKLGKRDLTIVLAATSYADAMQLSTELAGQVDFVIQSGEFRGTQPMQRLSDQSALLFASAQRGQALAKVAVQLGAGRGAFLDLSELERDAQQLEFLASQVKTLEERLAKSTDKAAAAQLKQTLGELQKRRQTLAAQVKKKAEPTARSVKLDWVVLGQDVQDDPELKLQVLKIEPSYAGAH
jgi:2',3'-cyclic-nucleotide 2'-phosphodiesterase (5'-nucleotidase family)